MLKRAREVLINAGELGRIEGNHLRENSKELSGVEEGRIAELVVPRKGSLFVLAVAVPRSVAIAVHAHPP